MDKEEKELEESVYSSLNIGSFLERKRKEQHIDVPKKQVVKVTPLIKEEPKKQAVTKKIVTAIEETVEPKKSVSKEEINQMMEPKFRPAPKTEPKKDSSNIEKKQDIHEILKKRKEEKAEKTIEQKKELVKQEIPMVKNEESKPVTKKEEPKPEPKIVEENHESKPEKKKRKKEKNAKKLGKGLTIGLIICIIMDLFAATGLFLAYGPVTYFRNLLVTSAMTTMSHKYLARIFYSDKTIEKVLQQNTIKEIDENTNSNDINFADSKDTGEYESIYEEEILKRDKDQLYKVININENGYVGYLVAIYDASRVELVGANPSSIYGGAFLTDIAKRTGAKVAINASGFFNGGNRGSTASGTVIMDGKIVLKGGSNFGGGLAGFNKDHVLVLTRESPQVAIQNGMVDAVDFGPFLIINGKAAEIKGDGGWGVASRTVLAQRKDGIVLFLVIDGRRIGYSIGTDLNGLIKILKRYNAHNAVNLDGGGSSTLAVEGKLTNRPCCSVDPTSGQRYVPNAWIVK